MVAFDTLPLMTLKVPFEDRYVTLITGITNNHPFIVSLLFYHSLHLTLVYSIFDTPKIATFRVLCCGEHHVRAFADEIIQKGGEGVILRKVASHYELGRSLSLLKLKVYLFTFYFICFVCLIL